MNLLKIIRPLRRLLFYGAVLAMAIDLVGGGLFALDSLGSAAAFTVGTAIVSIPVWGLQAVLVLFRPRHCSANEWFWSLVIAGYMTFLIVVFFTLAVEFNLE